MKAGLISVLCMIVLVLLGIAGCGLKDKMVQDGDGMERTPEQIMAGTWVCAEAGLTAVFDGTYLTLQEGETILWSGEWILQEWEVILPADGEDIGPFLRFELAGSNTMVGCPVDPAEEPMSFISE